MTDIENDLGVLHSILTEHMPGITLVLYKRHGIEPNLKQITEAVDKIYDEYLKGKPLTDVILITQILLQTIYQKVNKEARECFDKTITKKEFLAGYT